MNNVNGNFTFEIKIIEFIMLTYLLGAGASAETLPVINGIAQSLIRFDNFWGSLNHLNSMKNFTNPFYRDIKISINQVREELRKDLKVIISEILLHASIDTLARKYYLTNQQTKLRKLKAIIDIFFTLEQLNNGVDKRYDLFLSTILEGGPQQEIKLPSNINILSWNYDFQLEMSASNFFNSKFLPHAQEDINSIPRTNFINKSLDNFSVVKLNGACGIYHDNERVQTFEAIPMVNFQLLKQVEKEELIETLLGNYYYFTSPVSNNSSYISYAWENDKISNEINKKAIEISKKTKLLVVIGYSFPTFNREVDKMLLNEMSIDKLFIQSMPDTIDGVMKRAKALLKDRSINIEPIEMKTGKEEFYIPFEYA